MVKITFFRLNYIVLSFIFLTISDVHAQTTKEDPKITEVTEIDSLIDSKAYDTAVVLIREDLAKTTETDYLALARLYNKLSFCQLNTDKMAEGKENAEKALNLSIIEKNHKEEEGKANFYLGVYYDLISDAEKAILFLKKSLSIYSHDKIEMDHEIGKVHLRIASVYGKRNDGDLGTIHLDSAYALIKKVKPIDLESMGTYYFLKGNLMERGAFEKTEEYYSKALELISQQKNPNWMTYASIHSNMAAIYLDEWEDDKALKHLEESQEIQIREFGENYSRNARNYQMFSMIYRAKGAYSKSLDYLERALQLFKNTFGEIHPRVALTYSLMGSTYSQMRQYERALKNYEKAHPIFEKTLGDKHSYTFASFAYIGRTHFQLDNYQDAIKSLEKARDIGDVIYGPEHSQLSTVYRFMGNSLAGLKKNELALSMFQKAISIARNAHGEKSKQTIGMYNAVGNFLVENQEFTKALGYFEKTINSYESEINEFIESDESSTEISILNGILTAFKGKGKCLYLKYKSDGNTEDLHNSKKAFEQSELMLDKMRINIIEASDKIELNANNQITHKGLVQTFVSIGKQNSDQDYFERAFKSSEKNKAGVLQDMIYRSSVKVSDDSLKKLKTFETALKREKATLLSNLKTKRNNPDKDTTRLETYKNELFQIGKKYDSLLSIIQRNHPKYYAIEYSERAVAVQEIQNKLDAHTTLIEFFEGDSTLYAFVISKNAFDVSELTAKELTQDIEEFRGSVQSKDISVFKNISNQLYSRLVEPLETNIVGNKLILVPDGPIWYLNFDLLLTEQSTSKSPKDLPYLLKDFAISYSNSASYLYGFPGQKTKPQNDCLAFSFSDSLNLDITENISLNTLRNSKKDLPGSRMEIKEIANIVEGDYYYGSNASEANFKKNASNYSILHLALHGEVDDNEPENSRLFFTKSKDSIEDGVLYGHELFAMNIPAELTVLSACSTGDGKIAPGEGMMSLGNAFQYAGSKSLLMTHWDISDEVTPQIMKLFYTNLENGMDKATALQQAKLNYLENSDVFRSDPFYWGGFYLVGDTAPMNLGSSHWGLYVFLGLLLVLAVLFFLRRRFYTNN